jgi:beta-galactosidase/beta-glucuronidase
LIPKPEHPQPQFERESWLSLNGVWAFAFDDAQRGLDERWYAAPRFDLEINVPFAFQSSLSGIGETGFHDVVWYSRRFTLPSEWTGKRVLLHFGAVDYRATVWVNGEMAALHEGGHTSFEADITPYLVSGENVLVVRAEDASADKAQPRGKQYWKPESEVIFYTRTTGIWQTVWLEAVEATHIAGLHITPNIDSGSVRLGYALKRGAGCEVDFEIRYAGELVVLATSTPDAIRDEGVVDVPLPGFNPTQLWSPETPNLFDLTARLRRGETVLDEVKSYFGMRKIAVENGRVTLNNQPYYMKLVLDQGYYPDGLLTAPDDDTLRCDVALAKAMGFNGVRKHQKLEEPRYLYWADRLGLLVWGEMPSAYQFTPQTVRQIAAEWQEAIARDYNHPCIVAWVPLNESWGVEGMHGDPQQVHHTLTLYHLTKSLDPTRPVISNDGWEHSLSDLCTIHDYEHNGDKLRSRYASVASMLGRKAKLPPVYTAGFTHRGEPVLMSEFGGIAYRRSEWEGWGYSAAQNDLDFIRRYAEVIQAMYDSPLIQGFCYTQLTDVEQEINGLLTYDRRPKVDLDIIRAINEGTPLELVIGRSTAAD